VPVTPHLDPAVKSGATRRLTYPAAVTDQVGDGTAEDPAPSSRAQLAGIRRRAAGHRHLLTGSAVLVVGAAVQAITGALFWLIAARIDAQTDVGNATALFTSVLFVAFVAGLGLPVAVARYAAGSGRDDHVLFAWCALATALAAGAVAGGYVAAVPAAAVDELRDWHGAAGPLLFVALSVGTALALLCDVRLMTQRRWVLVLVRVSASGVARFPLLLIPVDGERVVWLLVLAAGPTALSGFVAVAGMPWVTGGRHRLGPRPTTVRPMVRYSVVNWLAQLTYQAPAFALPVVVLVNVDPDTNASFYVAWGVANLAAYVPLSIGQALLAEGGRDGARVRSQVRLALVVAVGLMSIGAVAAAIGSGLVVTLYGEDYAEAARVMPWLVAGAVPWAITSVYLTEARVQHRSRATVTITLTLSLCILVPAIVLVPDRGLDGAVWAYVGGNLAAAAMAVLAHVRNRRRPVPPDDDGGPGTPADAIVPDAGLPVAQQPI
jgi:O-antigen/teichoic acid export membrane protein